MPLPRITASITASTNRRSPRIPAFRGATTHGFGLREDELIVDSFAGGGGASLGIQMATGRSPDIAINHDAEAIAMHRLNHTETTHYQENVWYVDPMEATGGRPVGLMWASPDCTHHARARGGKPVNQKIRGLAWVVVRWAASPVAPRVIVMENVEELASWGPLYPATHPVEALRFRPRPDKKGATFKRFVAKLKRLGYAVEWKSLRACDFGAPTIRKRLFLVARCDGQPIVWPQPTHGPRAAHAVRTTAECIDWSLPTTSIFTRKKALAEPTLRRIARGLRRYVIDAANPFIITTPNGQRLAPSLIQTGFGEREGHPPRCLDLFEPLGTAVNGQKHALAQAFLEQYDDTTDASSETAPDAPRATPVFAGAAPAMLEMSHILKLHGTARDGQPTDTPLATIRAQGTHLADIRTLLARDDTPTGTLASGTGDHTAPSARVMVDGTPYRIVDIGLRMLSPRELYRAQGFPDSYEIDFPLTRRLANGTTVTKPLTKTAQVRLVGNSVVPLLACAIVAANCVAPVAVRRSA